MILVSLCATNMFFSNGLSNYFALVKRWLYLVDAGGAIYLSFGVDTSKILLYDAMSILSSIERVPDKIIVFINDSTGDYKPCYSNPVLEQAIYKGYTIYSALIGTFESKSALNNMSE